MTVLPPHDWEYNSNQCRQSKASLKTPRLSVGPCNGFYLRCRWTEWQAEFEDDDDFGDRDPVGWFSVYLHRSTQATPAVLASLAMHTKLPSGQLAHLARFTGGFLFGEGAEYARGWSRYVKKNELLRSCVDKSGALTLVAEISVTMDVKTELLSDGMSKSLANTGVQSVVKDLGIMLDTGLQSDVMLFVDGKEFSAHRNILAARSDVLKAMFEHKMKESEEGIVELQDIKPAVFQQLLKFIYTGECSFENVTVSNGRGESKESKQSETIDMAAHLLAAADRFQVAVLSDLAVDALMKTVTVENVADRLRMADACSAPELKTRCIDFIRADPTRLTEMMQTDGYRQLNQSQLQDLLSALAPPSNSNNNNSNSSSNSGKKRKREEEDPALTREGVKRLKVDELKTELRNRGLPVSGLKDQLIERLENAL